MIRALAGSVLVLLLLPEAAAAQEAANLVESSPFQAELRLERRLLTLDLLSYGEARERDQRAQQALAEVLGRLDQALAGDAVTLGTLEALQNDLDASRAAAQITGERLAAQLGRIQDRLRRIGLLDGEAGRPSPLADPVSGRWRVTVTPQNVVLIFDLRLNGTVVSGSYQPTAAGSSGSFRGTLTGDSLRLERIDPHGGFDSVWEGTVAGGQIAGTWMSNQLVTGQPNRGGWTAVREGGP
jgi:hypothetical protein